MATEYIYGVVVEWSVRLCGCGVARPVVEWPVRLWKGPFSGETWGYSTLWLWIGPSGCGVASPVVEWTYLGGGGGAPRQANTENLN